MRGANLSLAQALQHAHSAHQAGHLAEAERMYRLILRAAPDQFDALHLLGVLAAQTGKHDEANRLLGRALNVNPRSADALNNRANVLRALKRFEEALASCDRALAIKPDFAEALNNRGNVLHDLRRHEEALEGYEKALAIKPDYAKALANRADVLRDLKRYDEALASCERALAVNPDLVEALNNRGLVLHHLGRRDESLAAYDRALSIKPDYARVLANRAGVLRDLERYAEALESCDRALAIEPRSAVFLQARGDVLRATKQYAEAIAWLDRALAVEPANAHALSSRGDALLGMRRYQEALESCDRALEITPRLADAMNTRGNVFRELGKYNEAAASYEQAMQIEPGLAGAHYNLGGVLRDQGRREQAIAHYEQALALKPDFAEAEFALCMAQLSIVYRDEPEIARQRAEYTARLRKLIDAVDGGRPAGKLAAGLSSNLPFYLAYQGQDDRELQGLYGELACRVMADRFPAAPLAPPAHRGERVRIGIISGFFRHHSVWKIPIKGWLTQLDSRRFELFGYHTGSKYDAETEIAEALCQRFVRGPLPVERWREEILADAPHVLIYPEVGMDGMSLTLAAQRLAAVQCNGLGHPVTSGLPTMDHVLSSDLMEPPNGAEHYREHLIRLPNLAVYYEPPDVQAVPLDRGVLGLRDDTVTYFSGQSLFKYLPQYDHIYPRIAREVGACQFAFISHHVGSEVSDIVRKRLDNAFTEFGLRAADYCVFLPRLEQDRFIAVFGLCDVVLDSIGWSGNNSTSESLEHGLPIVTLRGRFMRGRHSAAILERMGVTDTIAESLDDYVSIAVRLGRDAGWRNEVRRRIAERKHRVYRDADCIAALEDFLERAAHGGH
ncbi:MAG TPA: tetratricopeptide repeat protein [Stellaceae bacterium]|nr:tetratricopeptide repeat protein [Stellaceae bacterium]